MTQPALDGRVGLVTGAGRGIGRSIAMELARAGVAVVINDADPGPAELVASEIRDLGGDAVAAAVSVTDFDAARAMVDDIVERRGALDILVSNAGAASSGDPVLRTSLDEVQRLLELHAVAAFNLCQRVLPAMRDAGRGDLILISSAAVDDLPPRSAPYVMAKAALEALAFTLSKEERRHGIRVNVVAPGMTDTRLGRLVTGRAIGARTGGTSRGDDIGPAMASPNVVARAVLDLLTEPDPDRTGVRLALADGAG